jgi:hypothetical protein
MLTYAINNSMAEKNYGRHRGDQTSWGLLERCVQDWDKHLRNSFIVDK